MNLQEWGLLAAAAAHQLAEAREEMSQEEMAAVTQQAMAVPVALAEMAAI